MFMQIIKMRGQRSEHFLEECKYRRNYVAYCFASVKGGVIVSIQNKTSGHAKKVCDFFI